MHLRSRTLSRYLSLLLPVGLLASSLFAGCGSDEDPSGDGANACLSNRQFFEQKVWASFMQEKCAKCHTPDGVAVNEQRAKFVTQTASYPNFLDTNMANIAEVAKEQYENQSKILLKPIGGANHGGGQVIAPDSAEYKALEELVLRLQSGEPCDGATEARVEGVTMLPNERLLRKAAIDLAGRLPTADEVAAVSKAGAEGDAALDAAFDALMREDIFAARLREIYNDILLTDRFLSYGGAAIDFMDVENMYPSLAPYRDGDSAEYKSAARPRINTALAREPLNLITYVVRNDRPFTEILTASYAVVNPYSAIAYGSQVSFTNPEDANELHETQVTLGTGTAVPHAGVLSTPAFLNRWVTSPTNRNRGRARRVYQFFLATDILKLAERPVDPSAVTAQENPTMRDSNCTMCHRTMDPVAGAFRGYDDSNYENFDGARPWHEDMEAPGIGGLKMPPAQYSRGLPWIAQELVKDPRFITSAVNTVYTGLTGHKPLAYPAVNAPDRAALLQAWEAQDAFFHKLGAEFKAQNFNIKVVFKGILKSPYYRADALSAPPPAPGLYEHIGTGRWLGPEMLNRKISAVLGIPWRPRWVWDEIIKNKAEGKPYDLNKELWLLDDYKLLYGGIDSDNVPVRLADPNGISASVSWRMANEMTCAVTAWDFNKPKEQRRFFPMIDPKDRPEYNGKTIDEAVKGIKDNLVHLHKLLLDETLTADSPEIERSYKVFLDTWRELVVNEEQKDKKQDINWECRGAYDYDNLVAWPEEQQLTKDKDYTIRSWMAVMTYLLLDYRFLYH